MSMSMNLQRCVLGGLREVILHFNGNGQQTHGDEFDGVRNQIRAEFLKNPEVKRYQRIQNEMASHEKAVALAQAKIAENQALHNRLTIEAPTGLAAQLLSLGKERMDLQRQADEAREQIAVLKPVVDEAKRHLQEILTDVSRAIIRPAVADLIAKRQSLVAEIEAAIAGKVAGMDVLSAAIGRLEKPGTFPISLAELLKGE